MTFHEKIVNADGFADLREIGIRCFEALSGKVWTDYNFHDPGITILEAVIYALSEIQVKASLPVEDLFLTGDPSYFPFLPPSYALSCEPVIPLDWKKSIIDLPGINRSWSSENKSITPPIYIDNLGTINLNGGNIISLKGVFDTYVELSSTELKLIDLSDIELNGNILRSVNVATFPQPDGSIEKFFVEFAFPFWESFPEGWQDESIVLDPPSIPGGIIYNSINNVFTALIKVTSAASAPFEGGVVIRFTPFFTNNTSETDLLNYAQNALSDISINGLLKRLNRKVAVIGKVLAGAQSIIESKRLLGTLYNPPKAARVQEIVIQADIRLSQALDYEVFVADIFLNIERLLSPFPDSYSEEELLSLESTLEQIYNGPLLSNGFLKDQSLLLQQEQQILYASDFINVILESSEFVNIAKLLAFTFSVYLNNYRISDSSGNCLKLSNSNIYRPRLSVVKSQIRLFRDGGVDEIRYDKGRVLNIFQDENINNIKRIELIHKKNIDYKKPDIPSSGYYSIQNDFPLVYGIGKNTLPESAPSTRLAQSRQLKAYLLLFEQLLSNSIRQMDNISQISSLNPSLSAMQPAGNLYDVPDVAQLLTGFLSSGIDWASFRNNIDNSYIQAINAAVETPDQFFARRNRYLDHLLARFGEDMTDYTALMLSNNYHDPAQINPPKKTAKWKITQDKLTFLRAIGEIESERGTGVEFCRFIKIAEDNPSQWYWHIFDPINKTDMLVSEKFSSNAQDCFDDLLNALPNLEKKDSYLISINAPYSIRVLANPPSGNTILANGANNFSDAKSAQNTIQKILNLCTKIWNSPNISGLEQKIGRFLGFDSINRRNLIGLKLSDYFLFEFDGANFAFSISMQDHSAWPLRSAFSYPDVITAGNDAQKVIVFGLDPANYAFSTTGGTTIITLSYPGGTLATISVPADTNAEELIEQWAIFLYHTFASQEGFYLLEHIQLLPRSKTSTLLSQTKFGINPYQYQISIIIPDGSDIGLLPSFIQNRLAGTDFRILLEKRLQSECPAHLFPYFIYPNSTEFANLQLLYKRWCIWKYLSESSGIELEMIQNDLVNWLNNSTPTQPTFIN
jgi:hypothetical protein